MREKISAFVITKNEEDKIEKCLRHLLWADEIVVIDSYSTDKTEAIVKKFTKKIYKKEFSSYGLQKQAAIDKCTNDWILEVDADEIVPEELQKEIILLLGNPQLNKHGAYKIKRQEYFLGKRLMSSKIPRLYKKECVKYYGEIHEKLKIKGSVGNLKNKIEHESDKYETIARRVEKINEYTRKEAEWKAKEESWTTLRVIAGMMFMPECYFMWFMIRKGLICKGYRGVIWSLLAAYYHFLVYAKIYEHLYKTKKITESKGKA